MQLINGDFSLPVSDVKTKDVAIRFKTDDHVVVDIIVEK